MNNRLIRLGLEINGALQRYEGLKIAAAGTKYTDPTQNDCSATVTGLKAATRDYILDACSTRSARTTKPRMTLEVGRQSTGYFLLYIGDITSAEINEPPDVPLTLQSKTNNQNNTKVISTSAGAKATLKQIAEQCAKNNGLALVFEASNKNISNYQFIGSAAAQVKTLQDVGGVDCFVDDGVLLVKDKGKSLKTRAILLSKDTGMVGAPKETDAGVEVQYLINGESQLGGLLQLQSEFNKNLSGDYVITELKFNIDTHGNAFFYTATGARR